MGNYKNMKKKDLSEFKYDQNSGVFRFSESYDYSYTDGTQVEERIFKILKRSTDNSIFSEELKKEIKDWVTEYHFSSNRHNLLRHFDFKDKSILELGSGCGAITRYLGEKASKVIGIEGSFLRAKCAAQRCRDLDNVKIYSSNFADVISNIKFDYVTLIGVLEYSALYIESKTPFLDCIKIAKKFLKDDGKLIIAIENKLGLKYFSGLSEDHTSKSYFGIYDLYKNDTVKTFGKYELTDLLNRGGLLYNKFLYPFPDYKVPTLILSDRALYENINLSDILYRILPRDYSGKGKNNFYNNMAWEAIEKNKLIDQFSNSFLVVSGEKEFPVDDEIIYHYTVNRRSKYNVKTIFKKSINKIIVSKNIIAKNTPNSDNGMISHKIGEEKYIYGILLERRIAKSIVANRKKELIEDLNKWLKFLFKNAIKVRKDNIFKSEIKNNFFDCIPKNIILKDEKLFYIDKEWEIKQDMSLYFLILKYFVFWGNKRIYDINKMFLNNKGYIVNIFSELGIPIIKDEFIKFEKFINVVHNEIIGDWYKFKFDKGVIKKTGNIVIVRIIKTMLRMIRNKMSEIVGNR